MLAICTRSCKLCHFPKSVFMLSNYIKTNTYRTVMLPLLYGCETWSLTLREEQKMRVSKNGVLREIFGPKTDELTG